MARKRYTAEQIIGYLRQAEVMIGVGKSMVEVLRELDITANTYYRWRKEYGGLGLDQARRLKELEQENDRKTLRRQRLSRQKTGGNTAPTRAGTDDTCTQKYAVAAYHFRRQGTAECTQYGRNHHRPYQGIFCPQYPKAPIPNQRIPTYCRCFNGLSTQPDQTQKSKQSNMRVTHYWGYYKIRRSPPLSPFVCLPNSPPSHF